MSKLDRFRRLERARPGAGDAGAPPPAEDAPTAARRFASIEPRRAAADAAPADPFSPPPEDPVELQLAHDDGPEVAKARAEQRARAAERARAAVAELRAAEAERPAEPEVRDPELLRRLARLGTPRRLALIGAIVLATAVAGQLVGPIAWWIGPWLVALVMASFFARH
jgi:hypothetical protein